MWFNWRRWLRTGSRSGSGTGRGRTLPRSRRPTLEALELRLVPSTYTVNSTGDTGSGGGLVGDLRYCITRANSDPGSTIQFDGSFSGGPHTITLVNGQLPILSANMTINGPGQSLLTIDAHQASRIFVVSSGVTASISGLTLTNGYALGSGGGVINGGTLTVSNCTLSNNQVVYSAGSSGVGYFYYSISASGGAIYSYGTLIVSGSNFTGNSAYGSAYATSVGAGGNASYSEGYGAGFGQGGPFTTAASRRSPAAACSGIAPPVTATEPALRVTTVRVPTATATDSVTAAPSTTPAPWASPTPACPGIVRSAPAPAPA